jgi:transcriptional regulator with XRE-family HTH domain
MQKNQAWDSLPGNSPSEKLSILGVSPGRMLDVRTLDEIAKDYGIPVYLFFEEDLARSRTLESVHKEYQSYPEFERPYIRVDRFLDFTRANDPSFEQTLREFPLLIEIVKIFDADPAADIANDRPCVTGLMPFLDELDVDAEPPV